MKELRLYDELRTKLGGGRHDYIMLVPDFLMLLLRVSRDPRLPKRHRLLAGSALLYLVSPVDFIPTWLFGPAGFIDDLTVATFALRQIIVGLPLSVLHEHWSGDDRFLPLLQRIVESADDWLRSGYRYKIHGLVRQGLARIART